MDTDKVKFVSRYSIGINSLTSLIQMGGGFVMEPAYQRIVIDCLNDPDETLKRKVYHCGAVLAMVHEVVATVYGAI